MGLESFSTETYDFIEIVYIKPNIYSTVQVPDYLKVCLNMIILPCALYH